MEHKIAKIAVCISSLVFGVVILVIAVFFAEPPKESRIEHINGIFSKYYQEDYLSSRGTIKTRYICLENGSRYAIGSVTYGAFDEEEFLSNVKQGDKIELTVEKTDGDDLEILAVNKGGQEFMNLGRTEKSMQNNQITGFILGTVFIFTGIIGLKFSRG